MATPMHVWEDIAIRYGATNAEEVDQFFQTALLELPLEDQQAIFDELMALNAVAPEPSRFPRNRVASPLCDMPIPPIGPPMDDDWS